MKSGKRKAESGNGLGGSRMPDTAPGGIMPLLCPQTGLGGALHRLCNTMGLEVRRQKSEVGSQTSDLRPLTSSPGGLT